MRLVLIDKQQTKVIVDGKHRYSFLTNPECSKSDIEHIRTYEFSDDDEPEIVPFVLAQRWVSPYVFTSHTYS